jgi:hypothetical protein
MPFPANWLEELLVEWLELQGFTISTSVSVPAPPGGKWTPDVVGARLDREGHLLIRHCEASMWLIQAPSKVAAKFADKFSQKVEAAVRDHFAAIFGQGAGEQARYEKWVVICGASKNVKQALKEVIPSLEICTFDSFIVNQVLKSISDWRSPPRKTYTTLPSDKWLLCQIDQLKRSGLIKL